MSLKAVRGTRDILPPEVERWQEVETAARRVFALYGLREIRTPIFEDSRVFEKGTGEASEIVQKEMYRFTDQGDHDLTLRPEGTPPVVRAYLEHHLGQAKDVTRLYYIGPMFRYERPQKGRYRQFHQIGVELFGSEAPSVDAEVVEMGMRWLDELGIDAARLALNSVGDAVCRPAYREVLVRAQGEILDELCDDCRQRHETNPLRVFDCKRDSCQASLASLPTMLEHLCDPCRAHFDAVRDLLERWDVSHEVDPRLVRGLDYYRRTVFEITSSRLGAQDALLGGGRYDGLVETLGGDDVPGVGFAAGVERVLLALPEAPEEPAVDCWVVTVNDTVRDAALDLVQELRAGGLRCVIDHQDRSMKAQMKAANRSDAPAVVIVGPDEVEAGEYSVKRMADGHQETAAGADLPRVVGEIVRREAGGRDGDGVDTGAGGAGDR